MSKRLRHHQRSVTNPTYPIHMTKRLDRRFRHVGRIKREWGTDHKATIKAMEGMLTTLFATGRLDILRALQDKTYSPLQVWDAHRRHELERLPTAATLAPLKESMEKWISKKECSSSHRLSLSQSLRHFLRISERATVAQLPDVISALRTSTQGKHPRSFNLARAAAQAFVKSTLKRSHPIYVAIGDIEPLTVTEQRKRHPLTPEALDVIVHRMKPDYGSMAVDMAVTGMGPSEYWGSWEVRADRITIHGTKRKGRERVVPNMGGIGHPFCEYAAFRRELSKASNGQVKPYDLRRSYANWLEAAGVPRTRRKIYMGHGSSDVTSLYEWHEVTAYLSEDAAKLRKYVLGAKQTTKPKQRRKHEKPPVSPN